MKAQIVREYTPPEGMTLVLVDKDMKDDMIKGLRDRAVFLINIGKYEEAETALLSITDLMEVPHGRG